jgi:ABC-type microcin C transport system permease subunit YejE
VNEQVIKIGEGKNQYLPPSKIAWFGTDDIGRDLYSRIIYGMRVSLFLGFIASLLSVAIGSLIGAVAGIKGGRFDDIMMRITDIFLAFPLLVSLLVVRNVLGAVSWVKPLTGPVGSIRFLIVLFVIFGWMGIARLVRAQVMSFKEREFIEAARAIGASNTRIVLRHMIPNTTGPLLVSLSLGIVGVIVFVAIGYALFKFRDRGQEMPEQSHGKPALEIGAGHFGSDREAIALEAEFCMGLARKRALHRADRLVKPVAQLVLDHRDHPVDRGRVCRGVA